MSDGIVYYQRRCDHCAGGMNEGFYVEGMGDNYFCSDHCLHSHVSKDDYDEMYWDGTAYWTEWNGDDYEYADVGGKIITIEELQKKQRHDNKKS